MKNDTISDLINDIIWNMIKDIIWNVITDTIWNMMKDVIWNVRIDTIWNMMKDTMGNLINSMTWNMTTDINRNMMNEIIWNIMNDIWNTTIDTVSNLMHTMCLLLVKYLNRWCNASCSFRIIFFLLRTNKKGRKKINLLSTKGYMNCETFIKSQVHYKRVSHNNFVFLFGLTVHAPSSPNCISSSAPSSLAACLSKDSLSWLLALGVLAVSGPWIIPSPTPLGLWWKRIQKNR